MTGRRFLARTRRERRSRRGNALLMFLLLLAFLGVLALVIDFGFVQLSRRQMQSGVNSAALEGLRFRDELPEFSTLVALLDDPRACSDHPTRDEVIECLKAELDPQNPEAVTDAELRNYVRRKASRRMVLLAYDEDYDLDTPNLGTTGAGPVFEFEDPDDLAGSNPGVVRQTRVAEWTFLPDPQLNLDNEIYGDLVAGQYHGGPDHGEAWDYVRGDFEPGHGTDDAFLVRLRRTLGLQGETVIGDPARPESDRSLDERRGETPAEGVSSSERALPLLFGRATPLTAVDPSTHYSVRRHGVTVRASSIAQAHQARSVGPGFRDLLGLTPFALERAFWEDELVAGTPVPVWIDQDGLIYASDPSDAPTESTGRMIRSTTLVAHTSTEIEVRAASGFPTDGPPFAILLDGQSVQDERFVTIVTVNHADGTTWQIEPPLHEAIESGAQVSLRGSVQLGDSTSPASSPAGVVLPEAGYVPIYDASERVIGFGWVEADGQPLPEQADDYPVERWLTKQADRIAPHNASATLRGFSAGIGDLSELWTAHAALRDALRAPVFVRSVR